MVEVQLTASMAGPKGAWNAGDRYECTAEEAKRMIAKGAAVPIVEEKVERATKKNARKEKRG